MNVIFNRKLYQLHQDRASQHLHEVTPLTEYIEQNLKERLRDLTRSFNQVLIQGARISDDFLQFLLKEKGAHNIVIMSLSYKQLSRFDGQANITLIQGDEECLPFGPQQFDLVINAGHMHHVNDVPGALFQLRQSLKPDGFFLGCMVGGQSLEALRQSLMQVEIDLYGGAMPRISPFADIQDMAALMQRAGFALPVIDQDILALGYPSLQRIAGDIRALGEGLCLAGDTHLARIRSREFFEAVNHYYQNHYSADIGGAILPVDIEVIFMQGWTPHASQQQPAPRGSAQKSMTEIL